MWTSEARTPFPLSRVVSVALLLFVFLLPLHFHFSFAAQVTKECSCIHGTRAQLAPPSESATAAQMPLVAVLAAIREFSRPGDWTALPNVRGPPVILSI
jgi:hypothetical protein